MKKVFTDVFVPPIKFVFADMSKEPIVAICLVNRHELESLGPSFDRAYPVQNMPCFGHLLNAIDEADRDWWRDHDKKARTLISE